MIKSRMMMMMIIIIIIIIIIIVPKSCVFFDIMPCSPRHYIQKYRILLNHLWENFRSCNNNTFMKYPHKYEECKYSYY
jgi:hypothetical protein